MVSELRSAEVDNPKRAAPRQAGMSVVEHIGEVRRIVSKARHHRLRIGLVPTMGALHTGHFSLMEAARAACEVTVVTIFVNPMQFGPNEDFEQYPRPVEDDLAACCRLGVDVVFSPSREAIYPPRFQTTIDVAGLSSRLEGKFRPGHFGGVATVVMKLLQIVQPDVAFFGQKDYQQQLLIKAMCRDLNVPVEIETCPIIRDDDGLAVSSRNAYLSPDERVRARALFDSLQLAEDRLRSKETNVERIRTAMRECLEALPDVSVDYATIVHPETLEEIDEPLPSMVALVAARVGGTRLIDNRIIRL